MGYTTEFIGSFEIDGDLNSEVIRLINGLSTTRRIKINTNELAKKMNITEEKCINIYGKEGKFYFGNFSYNDTIILNNNEPPCDQPGLWCQWKLDIEQKKLVWDYGEKFYYYVEWLKYLIDNVFKLNNIELNGIMCYKGEDFDDMGCIKICKNIITVTKIDF